MKYYYETGKIMVKTPYINGNASGVTVEYYESGKVKRETPYTNDKKDGLEKKYYETGKLMSVITYKEDSIILTRKYDENGNEVK